MKNLHLPTSLHNCWQMTSSWSVKVSKGIVWSVPQKSNVRSLQSPIASLKQQTTETIVNSLCFSILLHTKISWVFEYLFYREAKQSLLTSIVYLCWHRAYVHGLWTTNEGIDQRNLKIWANVADKYASAEPKKGVGLDFQSCNEGDFLTERP